MMATLVLVIQHDLIIIDNCDTYSWGNFMFIKQPHPSLK